jgi:hypothetical protein
VAYFITFTCYGCHLHGDESGSVDKRHNLPGAVCWKPIRSCFLLSGNAWTSLPYGMDKSRRDAVLASGGALLDHVLLVVETDVRPERVMNDLKSYASRCLNRVGLDEPARKRWARHGSTRWLWKPEDVSAAIRYVIDDQGDRMAAFENTAI